MDIQELKNANYALMMICPNYRIFNLTVEIKGNLDGGRIKEGAICTASGTDS